MNTLDIKLTRQHTNHQALAYPIQPTRSFMGGPNNEMPQRPNPMKWLVMETTLKSQE